MNRNILKRIIGGLSFTSALFVFQACYGTPQDLGLDLLVEGQVKSSGSNLPLEGIKVSVIENDQYVFTDEKGKFGFYAQVSDSINLAFEVVDSTQNSLYLSKDTVLDVKADRVYVDIKLDEK